MEFFLLSESLCAHGRDLVQGERLRLQWKDHEIPRAGEGTSFHTNGKTELRTGVNPVQLVAFDG